MMKLEPSRALSLLGTLGLLVAAFLPLSIAANPATLLAVRQVLPSELILPEDIRVARRDEGLFFEDAGVVGKVPEGTAVLKVGDSDGPDRLRLYVVDFSKEEHLESVLAESGYPVFCDFRALRRCFTRPSETSVEYLPHGAVITAGEGMELVYLHFPSGGSILKRHGETKPLASSYVHGQFKGEVDTTVLKETEGEMQVCDVTPPLVTGKQAVAITGTRRAPRIFCEKGSGRLLHFEPYMQTTDSHLPHSQQLEQKLTGRPATCDMLSEAEDHIFSVKRFDSVHGKFRGEKLVSYTSVAGKKAFVPVKLQAFPESELGVPCSTRNFRLIYQPNHILQTEVQHEAPLACHKLALAPLKSVEREALLTKIHGSNLWMELPAGTLLGRPVDDKSEAIFKLYSYQPTFTTTSDLQVTELHAMADDTELGPAVISTAEPPNGGSAAILYQQPDAKMVSIGYLQDGSFVGGPNLAFFTPDALNAEKILEYRVNQMHRGSSLLLSSVPEALVLQRDIIQYNTAQHGIPGIGRETEEMLAMLHRLRDYFSSSAEGQAFDQALLEINKKIAKVNGAAKELATSMLSRHRPTGGKPKNVVVELAYADSSGQLSVVLRVPINMLESPTSQGLIQQLHIALSLIVEDTTALPRDLANRTTFYGTALHTLYKILESGHCSSCPEGKTECSFCRAVMFRDFVHVKIQGLGINSKTMPDSLSWAEFRGQDFLAFAETSMGSALLGVEMDFNTQMLTRGSASRKHLPQLKAYATTCLNAHVTGMVLQGRTNPSQCAGLDSYLKNIVQTTPVEDFASLMDTAEFRDAVIEGCNVRVEDAVTSCIEGDGEMLALQRLPEFRADGRSSIYEYLRSLLFPVLLGNKAEEFETADLRDKPSVLSAAPNLSQLLTALVGVSKNNGNRPIVDYLFRDEASDQAVSVNSGIDAAVAAKGHKPSLGSTFYAGLWYSFKWALKVLEDILKGSRTSSQSSAAGSGSSKEAEAAIVREVRDYARRLQQQHPQKYSTIIVALSWPQNKLPETPLEARNFVDAAMSVVLVPGAILNLFDQHWNAVSTGVTQTMPERHVAEGVVPFTKRIRYTNPDIYGQVCQRLGWPSSRLPTSSEEAEAFVSALREVRAVQEPLRKWLVGIGEPFSETVTWDHVKAVIDKAHGPHSKVPFFLPSSSKCNCVRSTVLDRCYIDALKTTEDVVFRMTLLFPAVISEHISRNAKTLNTHAAALCASVGIFVTAWQQQQVEAGFEHPNGRLAHVMLIERLKNAGDYTITTIDENGYEDTSLYNRRKKELNNLFSRGAMKACLSMINAGAKVAYKPAGIQGSQTAARSLYGGIVNSVGASAQHVDNFVHHILERGESLPRRSRPPHPLAGLFAALRISQRFKDCFSASREMTFRSWYLMHLEGDNILRRVNSHRLGEELASATYGFATGPGADIFDEAFKTLMATVTTQWEDTNAFKILTAHTPGSGPLRLPEVAPEDFETSGDNQERPGQ